MIDEAPTNGRKARTPPDSVDDLIRTVSAHKIQVWSDCQAKWKYTYIDVLPFPPSPAIAFGQAYDQAVSAGYVEKQQSGRNPSPEDSRDRFAAALDEQVREVEDMRGEDRGEMLDQGVAIVRLWARDVAPTVRPLSVQREFAVEIQDWKVNGVVDLTMELEDQEAAPPPLRGRIITDHKTSARAWNAEKAGQQIQSVVYSFAARAGKLGPGVDSTRVLYDVAVRTKKPQRQEFLVGVGPTQHVHLLTRVDALRRLWRSAYAAGAFPPNRESMMCKRRFCPFWRQCEKEFGGKVRE